MIIPGKVAERIKKVREGKNYSQTYLAEHLGISQKAYSKIETGETKLSVDHLFKISEALEVGVNDLLSANSLNIFNNTFNHNGGEGIVVNKHTSEKMEELYEKLIIAKDTEIALLRDRLVK